MTGRVQQRINLNDGHALGTRCNLHDLFTGFDLSLLDDAKIKTGSAMRHEQCRHLRFVHADADPIAGDPRLRHLKDGTSDAIAIPDANLAIGQPVDGEILPELAIAEIASTELGLPIPVRIDLVYKDRPMLAAMPRQIPLPSPSMLSRRTMRRPLTGVFQIPVWTVFPRHATPRGRPTFTESRRGIASFSRSSILALLPSRVLSRGALRR